MTNKKSGETGQPEALASLAAAAGNDGKKPPHIGLHATSDTAPIPTSPEDKADAATKVLREGVLGSNQGADEAIKKLPDRTSQKT